LIDEVNIVSFTFKIFPFTESNKLSISEPELVVKELYEAEFASNAPFLFFP
jgi:hypothetical protein